ncbi:hypothetical protein BC834DRAFT_847308 [Gloeopeniophorella convolvens]|nr:hypothetical protein BC834DRAFT_847308 [Gloeopeniophorella convolvens]
MDLSFTTEDVEKLKAFADGFQKGDIAARHQVVEQVLGAVYGPHATEGNFDKIAARTKIRKWFYNHIDNGKKHYMLLTRCWSARNVYYYEHRAEINMHATLTGAPPGSITYLAALQRVTTVMMKECLAEDLERCAEEANLWSATSPPKHVQLLRTTKTRFVLPVRSEKGLMRTA